MNISVLGGGMSSLDPRFRLHRVYFGEGKPRVELDGPEEYTTAQLSMFPVVPEIVGTTQWKVGIYDLNLEVCLVAIPTETSLRLVEEMEKHGGVRIGIQHGDSHTLAERDVKQQKWFDSSAALVGERIGKNRITEK